MTSAVVSGSPIDRIRTRLALFSGDTGGIDSWLTRASDLESLFSRLARLDAEPLTRSQLNQLLALSHQAEVSPGFFEYYWLTTPRHTYDVTSLPSFETTFVGLDRIISLDQLYWGLYRIYLDSLLYFGNIRSGFYQLRSLSKADLDEQFLIRRFDFDAMSQRGPGLELVPIAKDNRYLISEQACKSFDAGDDGPSELLAVLRGAWIEHEAHGGGPTTFRRLLKGTFVERGFAEKQGQLIFSADELLEAEVKSEEELLEQYRRIADTFSGARGAALKNTQIYLSMANDLDVYVATSMRDREDFRTMATVCERIFGHTALKDINLRYFDPTMSAAVGHEDKGLIECLMVKCAKVLLYCAGKKDSYGKDAEAAMALSLGKPVIFLCEEDQKSRFFKDVHPLSRLVEFESGVPVGAMATSSIDDVIVLLRRIIENRMEYSLEQPRHGYFRVKEKLTGSTVRFQTNDPLLRETFWHCYHKA
jgi:hypothetical protein